jgi:hypothetical protein
MKGLTCLNEQHNKRQESGHQAIAKKKARWLAGSGEVTRVMQPMQPMARHAANWQRGKGAGPNIKL